MLECVAPRPEGAVDSSARAIGQSETHLTSSRKARRGKVFKDRSGLNKILLASSLKEKYGLDELMV